METEGAVSLIQTGGEFLTDSTSLQLQNDITLQSQTGITFSSLDLQTNTSLKSDSKISINSLFVYVLSTVFNNEILKHRVFTIYLDKAQCCKIVHLPPFDMGMDSHPFSVEYKTGILFVSH